MSKQIVVFENFEQLKAYSFAPGEVLIIKNVDHFEAYQKADLELEKVVETLNLQCLERSN
jgi:hypothetical protein